jgi:hypothetical protein
MTNLMKERYFADSIEVEKQRSINAIEVLTQNLQDNPEELNKQIDKEQKNLIKRVDPLLRMIAKTKENRVNLLSGKEAGDITFETIIDEFGNETIVEPNSNQEENVNQEERQKPKEKSLLGSLKGYALDLYNTSKEKLATFLTNPEQGTEEETNTSSEPNGIVEQTNGAMDALAQSISPKDFALQSQIGDVIDVDGQQATITGINENLNTGERSVDSIDYEIAPQNTDGVTTDEEIKSRQKTARLTKNNTFFDDRTNTVLNVSKKENKETKEENDFDLIKTEDLRRPNGSVGTQGFTEENLVSLARFIASEKGFDIPAFDKNTGTSEIRQVIEYLRENQDAKDKIFEYVKSDPVEINTLPDGSYHIQDGNHRANLLNLIGAENIPTLTSEQIKAKNEVNEKIKEELKKDISKEADTEREADYLKEAVVREGKKSIKDEMTDFESDLSNEKSAVDKAKENSNNEAPDIFSDGRESRISSVVDMIKSKIGKAGKVKTFVERVQNKAKNYSGSLNDKINETFGADVDHLSISQSIAINDRLEAMFPDLKPRVYAVENMMQAVGKKAFGYTLAGAIYIDEKAWNQDNVFMHEMSHIYYDLTKGDATTQAMMRFALQNEGLVNKIYDLYDDEIEYEVVSDGTILKKKHFFGQEWDYLTKEQRDMEIEKLIKDEFIKEVPLDNQSVIAEEVFAATLEGPLSKKFNKFFDTKEEVKRQFFAKKWWGKLKDRANKAQDSLAYNQQMFIDNLTDEQIEEWPTVRETIFNAFKTEIKGKDISPSGRAKAIEKDQDNITERINKIHSQIVENVKEHLGKQKTPDALQDTIDELDNAIDNNSFENFFEINRLQYVSKASRIIRDFAKNYNKVLRRRYYAANQNKATNWNKIPVFDRDLLTSKLFEISKEAHGSSDFIRRIEDSEVDEIFEFNEFLNKVRSDKQLLLQSMYYIYSNQSNINSVQSYVDKNGNFVVQNSLNNKEIATADNVLDKVIKSVGAYYYDKKGQPVSRFYLDKFSEFKVAADKIRSGQYSKKDIYDVLKFFSSNGINFKALMKENRLNINGKNYSLDVAVKSFLMSENGMKNDSVYRYDSNGKGSVKDGVRVFIQSIVATNRKFTADFTVQNAEGNQEPVRVIHNFLTREMDNITKDVNLLGKNKFIEKYSHLSKNFKEGARSNQLLGFIYESVKNGKQISLSQFHGVKNDNTGGSSVLKNSNESEQSLNDFFSYLSTGNKKNTYLMETGRFSDSPRSFMLEVPKVNLSDVGTFDGTNLKFNAKAKGLVMSAYNTYRALGNDITLEQFAKILSSDIQSEIKFIEANKSSVMRIKSMKDFMKDGKLNDAGKKLVAEYVLNQSFNGTYFNEIFFPSFPLKDRDKRAKSGISPGFAFGNHVQLEPIYFVDEYSNGKETTDAGIYILEEDANRLEEAGGNLMPLGKGYKILQTGIEHDNQNFKGKNLYDKGYATILNDSVVEQNPKLKGLYELMKKRREQYITKTGSMESNLLTGIPTHFLYAAPLSSNKSNNLPSAMLKNENGTDIPTEIGSLFTLDNLASNKDFKDQNELLDKWYYENDDFVGINGQNFVVQQVMDKETVSSNTPVQMIRALTTNAGINGRMEQAEKMQRLISEMQQENLNSIKTIIEEGSQEEVRQLLIDAMDMDLVDPLQRFQIEDGLSTNTPALREIAKNTLSNIIKRSGNKLKTPGSIAQQKPALYSKKYGNTNGTNGLAFYSEKKDGSLVKGEAILPSYMNIGGDINLNGKPNPNKLVARKVYTINDKLFTDKYPNLPLEQVLDVIKKHAENDAKLRGVGTGAIYSENNVLIGYYSEGDTIIATRIPAHGPQSTGVFEVIDFDTTGGSQVQLPFEFAGETTGGDFDGDQVFIQHKGKGPKWGKWNEVMKMIEEHWLSPEMAKEIQLGIEFKEDAENAITEIEKVYGKDVFRDSLHFSPNGRRKSYNNTLISKGNIGITANIHGLIGMLSSYSTGINQSITINKQTVSSFSDSKDESRTINSAKIFNIILDNAKYGYADKLGLNEHTVSQAMILRNLGFSLGEIGVVLNSDVAKEWSRIISNKENVFSGPSSIDNIEGLVRNNLKMTAPAKSGDIVINTNNITAPENQNAVLNLMGYLSTMTDEINKISKIMSGHKDLETNPFVMQEQINDFNNVLNNVNNKTLDVSEELRNNPLIKNYKDVAQFNLDTQRKFDPVFRKDGSAVYNKIINGTTRNMSKVQQKQLHDDIEVFYTSRLLGYNNLPVEHMENLLKNGNQNNIFDRVGKHIDSLSGQIIKRDDRNILNSITAAENNLLFSKALRVGLKGNNKFISLNNNFFNETMSDEERNRVIDEFNELPSDLKNDLILYDLIQNGWKGPQSLFHLLDKDFRQMVSQAANNDINNKENDKLTAIQKELLIKRVAQKNPEFFSSTTIRPLEKNGENKTILNPDLAKNKNLFNKIKNGVETIFTYKSEKGQEYMFHFKGWTNDDIAQLKQAKNNKDMILSVSKLAPARIEYFQPSEHKANIGLISIEDKETGNPTPYFDKEIGTTKSWEQRLADAKENKNEDVEGREMRSDYYRFHQTLSRTEFDYVMEFNEKISDLQKSNLFDKYLEDKAEANKIYQTVNEESVKKNSEKELIDMYSEYGSKNKFAYSKVLRAITMEIANRVASEQTKVTGKEYDGNDIGQVKAWLMSNTVPSNHPAVQGMVRTMEIEYKNYIEEKNRYVSKINDATDALYKEQFGYAINNAKPLDMLKSLYYGIFQNRDKFYQKLYGNLITVEQVTNERGETMDNMKYKSPEVIEKEFSEGTITPAQYDFYKVTRQISKELEPYALENKKGRTDYIPHTAPANMEKFAKRGLLGLLVNSKTIDQQIYDVTMDIVNPLTGKQENDVPFKVIEDWYNTISKVEKSKNTKHAMDFTKLKRKAIVLHRKGLNQNGTPIRYSNIEMGSAIGDVFMDRFSKGRSVAASDFPSTDLNKAFVDYVGATLFTNGNEKFQGFKKMLPVVDGILAQADRNGDKNMEQYVDKIWKQYFLGGKKQETLPNMASLEAIGLSTDKVVDYITKGSLIYWLGWKGLAIGGGVYAIGNTLIGKFNNISSVGGKTWLKGEQRFWMGKEGKFNPLNPFKGTKEANAILKNIGFMDLNVWDDVNVEGKNSFEKMFSSFALMPMTYSEKWIQGVQMLGMLTDEEWESVKDGGTLPKERLTEMENQVKLAHGKGYQATDQRMIQMYSWGRAMMQFSRYIPTVFYAQFAKEDIDIYGKKHMGNYTAVWKTIQRGINGEWTPSKFAEYRRGLDSYERKKLDSGLIGFGLLSAIISANHFYPTEHGNKLIADANIQFDGDKLASKLTPASVRAMEEIMK